MKIEIAQLSLYFSNFFLFMFFEVNHKLIYVCKFNASTQSPKNIIYIIRKHSLPNLIILLMLMEGVNIPLLLVLGKNNS